MLGLSANLNCYLFNGNVDLRKGIFRLCESIREEMSLDSSDASNVYMFMNEDLFRTMKLSGEQIKGKRRKLTGPILERIHHKVVMMMQDAKIMTNELMRKAVNYTLNQWRSLRNILKDGAAEISNNLCEQRMKPVKLLLKNCMNIGSEGAVENSAFIFSLIESCKLNGIDSQDYLKHLFECILHGKDCDKEALLLCFYQPEC